MSGIQSRRITIQLGLSGYSFTVYDRNGAVLSRQSHACPADLSVEELSGVLKKPYSSVSVYFYTWKYTMVPQHLFVKKQARQYLAAVRDLNEDEMVLSLDLPARKAAMVFAVPGLLYKGITGLCRNVRFYPTAYLLIDRISSLNDNNRLIISFSDGMLHIVAAERDRLLFVNSFPAADMATAEYFIMSVTKEVMFNPEHTVLYVYGDADEKMEEELSKYYTGVRYIL